jgi:hypothetical protein
MFILRGPYPSVQTTTLLPSPAFGDSNALKASVSMVRSMNGKLYTYVTSRDEKKKLNWTFRLSRNKALELREFINSYYAGLVQATDHNDVTWVGYLKNNPFEFTGDSRAAGWPGEELMTAVIEFEER